VSSQILKSSHTAIARGTVSEETRRRVASEGLQDLSSVVKETPGQETVRIYEFGPFRLDPTERKLWRGNEVVALTPRAFDTLYVLVRNSGRLLEKDDLIRTLWPDTFVEEGSLTNHIFLLRKALGENPAFIETVPRRGYRFVGAVRQLPHAAPPDLEKPFGGHRQLAANVPVASRRPWLLATAAITAVIALLAAGVALWMRTPARLPDRSQWIPLTKFPDSVSQPSLSADGRMLTFVRGDYTFSGPGQVYVKMLPDGQPVQLSHDSLDKMSPVFSPDGARIAYTTVDPQLGWDTWMVPTLGGEPQPWLLNASGLVWTGPHQVMFSKIRKSPHMGIVVAEESRIGERDLYVPAEPGMAHRSYPSPDRKWALLVEMDRDHIWSPCRLVPMDGTSRGRQVGPPEAACTSAAWSPDGRWMYFTSDAGGLSHIWRQRFPGGQPQQITAGPTEEEGIAMAVDGHSFVTAVALENVSVWLHDARGERQISLEGNATEPKFTPDGRKLCYRIVKKAANFFQFIKMAGEVWVADLESGRSAPLASGFQVFAYDISPDGKRVVLEAEDREGKPQLWLTSFERELPPQPIPNVEGRQPKFGPGGEIFFHGNDGFVYRVRPDGTGMQKALQQPILMFLAASPDGKWLIAWARTTENGSAAVYALPLGDGPPVLIRPRIRWQWSPGGRFLSLALPFHEGRTYIVSLAPGEVLPRISPAGLPSEDEIARLLGTRRIDALRAVPSPLPGVYAFSRNTTQRNLYRIPIP
jgi:DNA-binding winged helix-turn-helix (wHTH) protein/Tol biopolymer transport system component